MYYTEQQLVDALEDLREGAVDEEVEEAFSEHREETQGHVDRLEDIFQSLDMQPEASEDPIVDAVIEQHGEFVERDPDDKVLERYNILAARKSEHYGIASYGNLTPIAQEPGHDDVAGRLGEIMREEQDALDEVAQLDEEFDFGDIPAE
jgi:ferritin-like metal-binding protein YciE